MHNRQDYIQYTANGILGIKANWLYNEAMVFTKVNYDLLKNRGKIQTSKSIDDGRIALVHYDTMPPRFKSKVVAYLKGASPYDLVAENQLIDLIEKDTEAEAYFNEYTYEKNVTEYTRKTLSIPVERQVEYVANASIFNAIKKYIDKQNFNRKSRGGNKRQQWEATTEAVAKLPKHLWQHNLPTNARSFQNKFNKYVKDGYYSLIHKGFANCNSEVLPFEAKSWVLARWANPVEVMPNTKMLLAEYNAKAKVEGWKEIKRDRTLYNYLYSEEVQPLWYNMRYDELKAKEKYVYQFSTKMPTMRDSLWYGDGTKLNLYYSDENGKMATCQVYEVIDAYSEVLLGYHISKTENYEAQYQAYKMAAKNSGYRPYQITYDGQGGHKKKGANDLLSKIARLSIKTAPYNGKSKTIENAFYRFQAHYLKQDWYFTGQNITATQTESKVRMEFILANKNSLPTLQEAIERYAQRRKEWNEAKHPHNELSRIDMYENSENPKTNKITQTDMVNLFWEQREKTVKVSSYGIRFEKDGKKYNYMVYKDQLPDVYWLAFNIDRSVAIKYDPDDMSQIYLYEESPNGLRFLSSATPKIVTYRNKQEQEEWEALFYQKVIRLNKQLRVDLREKMYSILDQHDQTPEHYGLQTPRLKGVETSIAQRPKTKKKQAKRNVSTKTFGEVLKEISNVDAIVVDENHDPTTDNDEDFRLNNY